MSSYVDYSILLPKIISLKLPGLLVGSAINFNAQAIQTAPPETFNHDNFNASDSDAVLQVKLKWELIMLLILI